MTTGSLTAVQASTGSPEGRGVRMGHRPVPHRTVQDHLSSRVRSGAMFPSKAAPAPVTAARRSLLPIWIVVGVVGWVGLLIVGIRLWTAVPRQAGFDLELVLEAGRRVAQGVSPYDAAMLGGTTPTAVDLFYSYPPAVAQYAALFASVPSGLVLSAWAALAVAGLVAFGVLAVRAVDAP